MHKPKHRTRHVVRTIATAGFIALAAAGCSSGQKAPNSYNAAVQKQFVEGCEKVGTSDGMKGVRAFCTCAYGELRDALPFSEFKKVNSGLTDHGGPLPQSVTRIVARCDS